MSCNCKKKKIMEENEEVQPEEVVEQQEIVEESPKPADDKSYLNKFVKYGK